MALAAMRHLAIDLTMPGARRCFDQHASAAVQGDGVDMGRGASRYLQGRNAVTNRTFPSGPPKIRALDPKLHAFAEVYGTVPRVRRSHGR